MAKCSTCGAEILWAKSATTSRPMPLDAEPHEGGNVELTELGFACVLSDEAAALARAGGISLYRSHFATCSHPERHRKSRKKGA